MMEGWICPRCKIGVSPYERTCPECRKNIPYEITVSPGPHYPPLVTPYDPNISIEWETISSTPEGEYVYQVTNPDGTVDFKKYTIGLALL